MLKMPDSDSQIVQMCTDVMRFACTLHQNQWNLKTCRLLWWWHPAAILAGTAKTDSVLSLEKIVFHGLVLWSLSLHCGLPDTAHPCSAASTSCAWGRDRHSELAGAASGFVEIWSCNWERAQTQAPACNLFWVQIGMYSEGDCESKCGSLQRHWLQRSSCMYGSWISELYDQANWTSRTGFCVVESTL